MLNITFYKFVELKGLKELKEEILNQCKRIDMRGKIIIASEGVTGYGTGSKASIDKFEKFLQSIEEFKDIWIKRNPTKRFNSKRMLVKIKKEIITFKHPFTIGNRGEYISPKDLDKLYENREDFVLIDVRNDYEHELGSFKDAMRLNMRRFSQFPEAILKYRKSLQRKKIVTYCTGGIRCEKATAWMRENGFEEVYQLKGGIVNYGIEVGSSNWEGLCFVFDDRGAVKISPKNQKEWSKKCCVCFIPTSLSHTCHYCRRQFYQCRRCSPLFENCCSKFCRNKLRLP